MVSFPLLLIPLAIYNIIVFLMRGVSLTETLFRVPLVSGAEWSVSLSDILLTLGLLLLLLEVIKGARSGAKYLIDHLLSLVVFGCAATEFLLWPKFASSTFFLLVLLALVDFLSGIALRTRRSVLRVPAAAVSPPAARPTEAPPAEARLEREPPAPAPVPPPVASTPSANPVPSAASIAESVLLDHSGPRPSQPAVNPSEASPRVASPELQPNSGTPPASPEAPQR